MSIRKRFDPTLYVQTDNPAKNAVKEILKDSGFNIIDNPKKRDVDLLIYDLNGKHIANIECEVKLVWSGKEFTYEDINFPHRKEKYAILNQPTIFIMFNKDLTSYLTVTGDVLISSPLKEVPNKYLYRGEMFYKVSKNKAKYNDLINVLKGVI